MASMISRVDAPASVSAVTSTRLADGRDLLRMFDDTAHAPAAPARDRRDLPRTRPVRGNPCATTSLTGEWVSIAAAQPETMCLLPSTTTRDPLSTRDPDEPTLRDTQPTSTTWRSSRTSSPSIRAQLLVDDNAPRGLDDLARTRARTHTALGSVAAKSSASAPPTPAPSHRRGRRRALRTIVEAWAQRTASTVGPMPVDRAGLSASDRGAEIGVTLNHPHGQIYAYPYVTPRTPPPEAAQTQSTRFQVPTCSPAEGQGDPRARTSLRAPGCCSGRALHGFRPVCGALADGSAHLVPHRHIPDLAAHDRRGARRLSLLYPPSCCASSTALYDTPTPYIFGVAPGAVHEHGPRRSGASSCCK